MLQSQLGIVIKNTSKVTQMSTHNRVRHVSKVETPFVYSLRLHAVRLGAHLVLHVTFELSHPHRDVHLLLSGDVHRDEALPLVETLPDGGTNLSVYTNGPSYVHSRRFQRVWPTFYRVAI